MKQEQTISETTFKFKAGDVAKLKSGGLPMTVEGHNSYGAVMCAWFDGKKHQKSLFTAYFGRVDPLISVC